MSRITGCDIYEEFKCLKISANKLPKKINSIFYNEIMSFELETDLTDHVFTRKSKAGPCYLLIFGGTHRT